MALTNKQAAFVREYLVDLNATQAAIRAGYSETSAHSIGHENLSKPEISSAIQKAFEERAERIEVTQDEVLEGLLTEARRTGDGASHSARVSAWSWAGRHLGMFTDKVEHSGSVDRPELTVVLKSSEDE